LGELEHNPLARNSWRRIEGPSIIWGEKNTATPINRQSFMIAEKLRMQNTKISDKDLEMRKEPVKMSRQRWQSMGCLILLLIQ